ncbi:unnamed protein product [Rotaria magnacalcarata]
MTRRQKRAIKLQQLRDDTLSLNDLVRYAQASLNLNISRQTVSRILREFDLVSYVAPIKPQITHEQRRCRIFWCYKHLSWTETGWSNVIFPDEANFEIVTWNNRIYIRRFWNDVKRHERFQPRVHRGGGLGIWSYITYNDLGPPKPDTLFTEQKDTSTAKLYDFLTDLNLSDTDLTINESEQLKLLLVKYYKSFEDQLGRTSLIQHHIDTGNTKPIKLRPYRVSPARKEISSTELTKMINAGIIERCNSPYAAPITLQPKKTVHCDFVSTFVS